LTRPALALLCVAVLVLTGCSFARPVATSGAPPAPPVDTECVTGMAFVTTYTAIAGRYDPRLEADRQQLAATHSLATARALLGDIANQLSDYDAELDALHPPADFSDGLKSLLSADQRLRDGALELAASTFGVTDQASFQQDANDRQAALHDLRLEVAFVTSECQ